LSMLSSFPVLVFNLIVTRQIDILQIGIASSRGGWGGLSSRALDGRAGVQGLKSPIVLEEIFFLFCVSDQVCLKLLILNPTWCQFHETFFLCH
jgi:hypothetical protein